MTYCVGLLLNEGMVCLSDTRTNAGLDNIATYRKMFHFVDEGGQTVVSVPASTTVRAAAITMSEHRIGAILVVDGAGQLTGLFTERDVLNRVVALSLDPDTTPLSAVMTGKLQTATPDKPLAHALHMIFEGGFRHVPVVENGKPVGMVTARNALGLDIHQFEKELKDRDHIAENAGKISEVPDGSLSWAADNLNNKKELVDNIKLFFNQKRKNQR